MDYLSSHDLEVVVSVDKYLKEQGVAAANHYERNAIKAFLRLPIHRLEIYTNDSVCQEVRRYLFDISLQVSLKQYPTLANLKEGVACIKSECIRVLARLDRQIVNSLFSGISSIHFFKKVPEQVELQRKIDETLLVQDQSQREESLAGICRNLSKHGLVHRALYTANLILEDKFKNEALSTVAAAVARGGNLEFALKITNSIEELRCRNEALNSIVCVLAQSLKFDLALVIAETITIENTKIIALASVAYHLAKSLEFDRALSIIHSIITEKDESFLSGIMQEITLLILQSGDLDKATIVACSIPDKYHKNIALRSVFDAESKKL